MNDYFKFDEQEFKEYLSTCFNYKNDKNYDKDLDIIYELKISNKDKDTDKTIVLKEKEEERKVKIHIPREITNGQSILLIGEGRKLNNKYGNLIVNIKLK